MVSTIEAKKATLVHKAAALAGQLFDPADQAGANRFIAQFYEHVPPADVAGRTPRNLYGAALSLCVWEGVGPPAKPRSGCTTRNRQWMDGRRRTRSSRSSTTTCLSSSTR